MTDHRHPSTAKFNGSMLIELLIVPIVVAMTEAIVLPASQGITEESRLAALDANLTTLRKAITLYCHQAGHHPGTVHFP